jgi:hypothetical protein
VTYSPLPCPTSGHINREVFSPENKKRAKSSISNEIKIIFVLVFVNHTDLSA